MTRLLLLTAAALAFSGCGQEFVEDMRKAEARDEARACAVVKEGIQANLVKESIVADADAAARAEFTKCNVTTSNGTDYTVAMAAKVPHVDEHGTAKPDTFYYGFTHIDPKTKEMRLESVMHN